MSEKENNSKRGPQGSVLKKWWFWMIIIFAVFAIWCIATRGDSSTYRDTIDSYMEIYMNDMLEELGGTIDEETDDTRTDEDGDELPADKQSNASAYERSSFDCWEDTAGEEFFAALCLAAGIDEIPDASTVPVRNTLCSIYETDSEAYSLYVEADAETDEIHYFKIEILDWEAAGETTDLFVTAVELIGTDILFTDGWNESDFTESVEEFTATLLEEMDNGIFSSGSNYVLLFGSSVIELFAGDTGWPAIEVMAADTDSDL